MDIREAVSEDNDELQALQAKCPQGTTVVVSIVNTPDFFARARTYEMYKVFAACTDNRIIGSAAVGIREAVVNGEIKRLGYEFQYFTSPDYRRRGVGRALHQHIEDYLIRQGVVLSYLLIMEGNHAPMRLFESEGFRLHRTLIMPIILVFKKTDVPSRDRIRPLRSQDLDAVAGLLNDTWQGYDLYGPRSAEGLAQFIDRTPAYASENLFVMEDKGEILACLGFWDWSQIARITVEAVSLQMRIIALMVGVIRHIRSMPRFPKAGTTMKQWCLTPIAYRDPEHLTPLIRYMNNLAMERGIEQIYCLSERKHPLLRSMEGLFRRDVVLHVYVKPLQEVSIGTSPVFIDGIDL